MTDPNSATQRHETLAIVSQGCHKAEGDVRTSEYYWIARFVNPNICTESPTRIRVIAFVAEDGATEIFWNHYKWKSHLGNIIGLLSGRV